MSATKQLHLILCVILLAASSASESAFGQGNEKTLTLNSRNLKSALAKKGRFPIDITVNVRGNRPSFNLVYLPTEEDIVWDLDFDITGEEFTKTFNENNHKNLKLICHHEYRVKGKTLHVALWHFDRNHEAPKEHGTIKDTPKPPQATPLGQVWSAADKIPSTGELVRGFAPLDKTITDFMKANQVPGLSVAVFHHGKPVYARAFGYSDIPTMTTLKPDQPMRIFHISWIFTSAAVMKLVEDKKLNLDEPVFDLLELKEHDELDPLYKKITVRHLLQSSGGFAPQLSFNPFSKMRTMAKALNEKDPLTREQVIEYMLKQPLDYEPGTQQANSSFGFMLLGRVVEKVSGMSYEEYVQKNILKKLKTKSVALGKSRKEDRNKKEPSYYSRSGIFATQIASKEDHLKWVNVPDGGVNMDLIEAGGGWITTPTDLLTIVNAIRTTDNSPILDRNTIQMIFSPPTGIEKTGTGGEEDLNFKNNGWDQEVFDKNRVNSFKYGSGSGSSAFFLYRHDGFSWAAIANAETTKDNKDIGGKLAPLIFYSVMDIKRDLGIK